jgi:2-methylaconitate cis-trans-isomerase PrpF
VRVPGVAAGGVEVGLAFPHPAGSTTGRLLPTDAPVDVLESAERSYRTSMVDAGAPCAFFDEHDVPLDAETLDLGQESCRQLLSMRHLSGAAMDLRHPGEPAAESVPKVGVVGAPCEYVTSTGQMIRAEDYDLTTRMISMRASHPAIGMTSAVAVATATAVPSTLPALYLRRSQLGGQIRIGTSLVVVRVSVEFGPANDTSPALHHSTVTSVTLGRTARLIALGRVWLPFPDKETDDPRTAESVIAGKCGLGCNG